MIESIISNSKYLDIIDGNPGGYISSIPGGGDPGVAVGQTHYNMDTQTLEVYNGQGWVAIQQGYTNVDLTTEAEELLEWAKEKRNAELSMQALANDNKAVQIALNNLKEAENQLAVTAHLARKHEPI